MKHRKDEKEKSAERKRDRKKHKRRAAARALCGRSARGGQDTAGYGGIWRDMAGYGQIWSDMVRYGQIWRDTSRYGKKIVRTRAKSGDLREREIFSNTKQI